jgi:hypothetical protein
MLASQNTKHEVPRHTDVIGGKAAVGVTETSADVSRRYYRENEEGLMILAPNLLT